jgi:hypothetical protein
VGSLNSGGAISRSLPFAPPFVGPRGKVGSARPQVYSGRTSRMRFPGGSVVFAEKRGDGGCDLALLDCWNMSALAQGLRVRPEKRHPDVFRVWNFSTVVLPILRRLAAAVIGWKKLVSSCPGTRASTAGSPTMCVHRSPHARNLAVALSRAPRPGAPDGPALRTGSPARRRQKTSTRMQWRLLRLR